MSKQGFAIGNGLTDPSIQYKAYTDYALNMKIIGKSDYDSINELIPECEESAKSCGNYSNSSLHLLSSSVSVEKEDNIKSM